MNSKDAAESDGLQTHGQVWYFDVYAKNLQFRTSDFDFRTTSGPVFRTQIQTKFNPTRHSSREETQFRTIFRTLFRTLSQTCLAEFPDAFPDAFPDFPSLTLGSSTATHVAAVFHMLLFPHINAFWTLFWSTFLDTFPDRSPDFSYLTPGSSPAIYVAAVSHMLLFPHM